MKSDKSRFILWIPLGRELKNQIWEDSKISANHHSETSQREKKNRWKRAKVQPIFRTLSVICCLYVSLLEKNMLMRIFNAQSIIHNEFLKKWKRLKKAKKKQNKRSDDGGYRRARFLLRGSSRTRGGFAVRIFFAFSLTLNSRARAGASQSGSAPGREGGS